MPAAALERAFRDELTARWKRFDAQFVPSETLAGRPPGQARGAAAEARQGVVALAAGNRSAARAALARARKLPAGSPEDQAAVLYLAGDLALGAQDAAAAAAAFTGLLTLGPAFDGYDVRVRLALAELHRGDIGATEAHLRRAISFDDARVEPHALLAEMFAQHGREDDRGAELEAALRLDPQNATRAKELALGSARAGRSGRARWAAQVAIFIDPADADLHATEARALLATGEPAQAARAFERALLFEADPAQAAALHGSLADLYKKLGDPGRAGAHRAAAAQRPSAP
jgi:Tfp pilus assembly protein PilF